MGTIIDGIWSDDFAFKTGAIVGWDIYNAPTDKTYYEPPNITVTDDNNKLYHGPFSMLKYVNNEMRRWFKCTDIENSTDIYDVFLSYQAAFCNSTSNDDIQMYTNDTIINSISAVQSGTTINDNTFSTNVQNTGCSPWYIITASELLLFNVSSGIRFDLVLRIRTNDNVYAVISNIEIECRLPPTMSPTINPTMTTKTPTMFPSFNPTINPTVMPTNPTFYPTTIPTKNPTKLPTIYPTKTPTKIPTQTPTKHPTQIPTKLPTKNPSGSSGQIGESTAVVKSTMIEDTEYDDAQNVEQDGGNTVLIVVTICGVVLGICIGVIIGYLCRNKRYKSEVINVKMKSASVLETNIEENAETHAVVSDDTNQVNIELNEGNGKISDVKGVTAGFMEDSSSNDNNMMITPNGNQENNNYKHENNEDNDTASDSMYDNDNITHR
eukprot:317701_1